MRGVPALCSAVLAALVLLVFAPGAARAQGVVRSVHGEWQIRCDTPPGAPSEQCVMMQRFEDKDRPNFGLAVIVMKTADKKGSILRVLAPLGVRLDKGLGLIVDGNFLGRVGFSFCAPNGCVAQVEMDDTLLDKMRAGKEAVFFVNDLVEADGIGVPVDLKGFGEGYDALP